MTTHEVLVGALNVIETEGWQQKPDLTFSAEEGPACAYFALARAAKPHGLRYFPAYLEALDALAEAIGCESDPVAIGEWNDAPERTVEEVYGVLAAAIAATAPEPDLSLVDLLRV